MIGVIVFAANKTLEKKVTEGEEVKMQIEAEMNEKIKTMEKELENATTQNAGKHCCKKTHTPYSADVCENVPTLLFCTDILLFLYVCVKDYIELASIHL